MSKQREWYGVFYFDRGWVLDTCAGGAFGDEKDCKLWASASEAAAELQETDMIDGLRIGKDYEIVPLQRSES